MNKYDTGNYNYCIKNTTDVWNLTPPANINTNTSTAYDTSSIKVDITDTMVLCKMTRSSYVYNVIPTRILIISYNNTQVSCLL